MLVFFFTYTPLKFYVQSIWRDEAFSYLLAKQNVLQILTLTAKDFNPPLYYVLLHVWINIVGSSEIALRTLSFWFFLATLYVIGLFLIEVFKLSIKETFFYLLLFVFNPVLNYYAFEARMYTLFAFFATLSFYYLAKKSYRKYALVVIFGLYTHYFMLFALLSQLLFMFITDRKKGRQHMSIFVKIGLYFLPWVIFVIISKPQIGQAFWIPPLDLYTFLNVPGILLSGYEHFLGYVYPLLSLVSIIIVGIIGYYAYHLAKKKRDFHHDKQMIFFFISWVLIPTCIILLISIVKPLFLPRYMIFITVGLLLLLVFILHSLTRKLKYIFLALLLIISFSYTTIQAVFRGKADVKKPLTEIKHLMKAGDVVYVTHEFNFHPAEYYINDAQVYLYGKTYEQIPSFVGKVLIPKNKIVNTLPFFPHRAFILKDDLSYSIQALY